MAMILVFAVGLVLALTLLTVREPPRRSAGAQAPAGDPRFWLQRWRLYLPHHTAFAFLAFSVFGMHAWTPTAIMREHGWSPAEVGFIYGVLVSVTGCAGALGGGFLGDRLQRQRGPGGRFAAVPVLMGAAVVGGLLLFRQTSPASILAGIALVNLCLSAALAIGVTSVADIAPAPQRGMTTAAYLLFSGIIGAGVAPAVIGVLNDDIGSVSIHLSQIVAGVSLFGIIASAALFLVFFRQIRTAANAAALAEID
jgi:MFS family permease